MECQLCAKASLLTVEAGPQRLLKLGLAQVAGEDEDLLLVDSDDEGLDAEAAALAARRTFALQNDSLFGLDSQSQQLAPLPMPAQSAPAQVRLRSHAPCSNAGLHPGSGQRPGQGSAACLEVQ